MNAPFGIQYHHLISLYAVIQQSCNGHPLRIDDMLMSIRERIPKIDQPDIPARVYLFGKFQRSDVIPLGFYEHGNFLQATILSCRHPDKRGKQGKYQCNGGEDCIEGHTERNLASSFSAP